MKKHRIITIIVIMSFLSQIVYSQQDIVIGTDTNENSQSVPFNNGLNSWSESYYTKSEIGNEYLITTLSYNVHIPYASSIPNQKIYMAEVSDSIFTHNNFYIEPSSVNASLVYNDSISFNTSGWKTINLIDTFHYSGLGNLLIIYENRRDSIVSITTPFFKVTKCDMLNFGFTIYTHSNDSTIFNNIKIGNLMDRPNIKLGVMPASSNDIGISELISPNQTSNLSSSTPISVQLKNFGSNSQSGFSLKYSIDNGLTWVNETYSGSISSGNTATFTFINTANLTSASTHKIIVAVDNYGDNFNLNDTIVKSIVKCNGAMNGNYLIGKSQSADFYSINAAIKMLKLCGVNGPVTFNIEPGTYKEQIKLSSITGLSSINNITFQSITGNPSDVIIKKTSPNYYDRSIVYIDSLSHIKLRGITIKALNNIYSNVALIKNSSYINIENCILSTITRKHSIIDIKSNNNYQTNHITIKNNIIDKGYKSISVNPSSGNSSNIVISGNLISDFLEIALDISNVDSTLIEKNTIISKEVFAKGIEIYNSSNYLRIQKNSLNVSSPGLSIEDAQGTSSGYNEINNNMIIIRNYISLFSRPGIEIKNSEYLNINYNSVLHKWSNFNVLNYPLEISQSTSNVNLNNNNFINKSEKEAVFISNNSSVDTSDFNNFYSNSIYKVHWINFKYSTIPVLFSNTSTNQNSSFSNVNFYSDINLHTNDTVLNNKALPISGITEDIDGEQRSGTNTDIGADEFTLYQTDGALIEFIDYENVCPNSAADVKVKLKNVGTTIIDSVSLDWKVNGVSQNTKHWSGTLFAGDEVIITLGSQSFDFETHNKVEAYFTSVNSLIDSNNYNDTIRIRNLKPNMSGGSYQIGKSASADFKTINEALEKIEYYGICAPITFYLETGIYKEYLDIKYVDGVDSINTITFQSITGNPDDVSIEYNTFVNGFNYIISFKSASNILFKNITIKSNLDINVDGIITINSSNNISFDSCKILGCKTTIDNDYSVINIYSNTTNVRLTNNFISGGYYGIKAISSTHTKNFIITNNKINDFYRYGISIEKNDKAIISSNILIDRLTSPHSTFISVAYGYGNKTINNNIIKHVSGKYTTAIVIMNEEHKPNDPNYTNIYNNMISISADSIDYSSGITIGFSNRINVLYNTIRILKTKTYNSSVLGISYSDTVLINNNVFQIDSSEVYEIHSSSNIALDYNCIYTTGNIASIDFTIYNSFLSWQLATNEEQNSIFHNPIYLNNKELYIHDPIIANSGIPIIGITHDIDGNTRSTTNPDIGANEFEILSLDVMMTEVFEPSDSLSIGQHDIKIRFKNIGFDTLNSLNINWSINGNIQSSSIWTGNLALNSLSGIFNLGTYNFSSGNYNLKVWCSNPNSSVDMDNSNDSIVKNIYVKQAAQIQITPFIIYDTIYFCDSNSISKIEISNIGGDSLYYHIDSSSVSWLNIIGITEGSINPGKKVVVSFEFNSIGLSLGTSTTSFNITSNDLNNPIINVLCYLTYHHLSQESVDIGPDTVLFGNNSITLDAGSIWQSYQWNTGDNSQTIFVDSAGYGIGAHTFWVKVEDQMGCFGSDTVLITIDDCTGFEHILSDNFKIKVYPNPSNSDIYLDMEAENIDEIKLNIFNSSGKLIKSEIVSLNTGELTHKIDMSTYAKGIYILQINSDYFRKSLKIVLQ